MTYKFLEDPLTNIHLSDPQYKNVNINVYILIVEGGNWCYSSRFNAARMHNYLINVCGLCVQEAYLLVQIYRNVQFAKDGVDNFVIRVRGQASPTDGCIHL